MRSQKTELSTPIDKNEDRKRMRSFVKVKFNHFSETTP